MLPAEKRIAARVRMGTICCMLQVQVSPLSRASVGFCLAKWAHPEANHTDVLFLQPFTATPMFTCWLGLWTVAGLAHAELDRLGCHRFCLRSSNGLRFAHSAQDVVR